MPVDVPIEIPDVPAPPAPEPSPSPSAAPAPAPVAPQDPPGNNGTIKVDGRDFDSHPDNEPHVGCTFQIDFYGYDQGELYATVLFEGIPPTGGGELETDTVFIGGDAAGGGTDLDASVTYDLSEELAGIEPHAQGHHVKLTIEAEGSQGSPVKHKVFWVEGCRPPTPPPTTPPPTTPPPTTPPPTTPPPTTPPPNTPPPTTPPATTPPPAIAGPLHIDELPAPQADEVAADDLPRTGSESWTMVAAGVVFVTMGAVALALGRRLRMP